MYRVQFYDNLEKLMKETDGERRIIVSNLEPERSRENIMIKPDGDFIRLAGTNPKYVIIDEYGKDNVFTEAVARTRMKGSVLYINPKNMPFKVFERINAINNYNNN